jgi:hypothetical protein
LAFRQDTHGLMLLAEIKHGISLANPRAACFFPFFRLFIVSPAQSMQAYARLFLYIYFPLSQSVCFL